MNHQGSDICQTPTNYGKNTRTSCVVPSRCLRPGSDFFSWLPPFVSVFCFGLTTAATGGLLLGRAAAVTLRSLELLSDNALLMDELDGYIVDADLTFGPVAKKTGLSRRTTNDHVFNVFVSVLVEEFGVFSVSSSVAVGIFVGLSAYELVVKRQGGTATGRALAVAGPACLLGVTAAGSSLGWTFEAFLTVTSRVSVTTWLDVSQILAVGLLLFLVVTRLCCDITAGLVVIFLTPLTLPAVVIIVFTFSLLLKTKLTLMVALMPVTVVAALLRNPNVSKLTIAPIPLMLMVTDVFNFARQPIVTLQSTTNRGSAAVEGVFVGVLTSQFLMVSAGVSLFASSQRDDAGKIWAGAAASGAAVLSVIESLVPVLGPGPAMGALTGVAGAVGVTLAAAGAATDRHGQDSGACGWVGRLGVTSGAAVGAFLTSRSVGGLSGVFTALCAATVPVGFQLEQLGWKLILGLCFIVTLTMNLYFSLGSI